MKTLFFGSGDQSISLLQSLKERDRSSEYFQFTVCFQGVFLFSCLVNSTDSFNSIYDYTQRTIRAKKTVNDGLIFLLKFHHIVLERQDTPLSVGANNDKHKERFIEVIKRDPAKVLVVLKDPTMANESMYLETSRALKLKPIIKYYSKSFSENFSNLEVKGLVDKYGDKTVDDLANNKSELILTIVKRFEVKLSFSLQKMKAKSIQRAFEETVVQNQPIHKEVFDDKISYISVSDNEADTEEFDTNEFDDDDFVDAESGTKSADSSFNDSFGIAPVKPQPAQQLSADGQPIKRGRGRPKGSRTRKTTVL